MKHVTLDDIEGTPDAEDDLDNLPEDERYDLDLEDLDVIDSGIDTLTWDDIARMEQEL